MGAGIQLTLIVTNFAGRPCRYKGLRSGNTVFFEHSHNTPIGTPIVQPLITGAAIKKTLLRLANYFHSLVI